MKKHWRTVWLKDGGMRSDTENSTQNHMKYEKTANTKNPEIATRKKTAMDCLHLG